MSDEQFAQYLHDLCREGRALGGTDAGSILGVSEWGNPQSVWDRIMGLSAPIEENPHMERGKYLEGYIADRYARETGRRVTEQGPWYEGQKPNHSGGFAVLHPIHSFLHASPDRLIDEDSENPGVLEIKAPSRWAFEKVKRDGVSAKYYAQLQHYLNVKGYSWGSFAFFCADAWELYWFDVMVDVDYVNDAERRMVAFWTDHVLTRTRPGSGLIARVPTVSVPRVGADTTFRNDPAWESALNIYKGAVQELKIAELAKKAAEDRIKALMGDADRITSPTARVTHSEATRRNFDKDALLRDHPHIDAEQYTTQSAYKTFRVTFTERG